MNFLSQKIKLVVGLLSLLMLFFASCEKDVKQDTFRVPAEWEAHESIWLGWPNYNNKADWSSEETMLELIGLLVQNGKVDLCVADEGQRLTVYNQLLGSGLSTSTINSKIRFHNIPHNDWWYRDMGGIFLKDNSNGLKVVDFDFNTWGYGPFANADPTAAAGQVLEEGVDRAIANALGLATERSSMIMEGGALDFNGQGTMMVSWDVVSQRNPNMSKAQAEDEFKRLFRLKKVIWLEGYLGNDAHTVVNSPYMVNGVPTYTVLSTNGHTDEFVRFVSSNKVLLCGPPTEAEALSNPIAAQSRSTLLRTRQILEASTDQDGRALEIIELPEPPLMYQNITDGDGSFDYITLLDFASINKTNVLPGQTIQAVFAASYMNYLVTNNMVLVPRYAGVDASAAASDAQAIAVLQAAFPGRQVVSMDVKAINIGGGGIHCITQQMPIRQ